MGRSSSSILWAALLSSLLVSRCLHQPPEASLSTAGWLWASMNVLLNDGHEPWVGLKSWKTGKNQLTKWEHRSISHQNSRDSWVFIPQNMKNQRFLPQVVQLQSRSKSKEGLEGHPGGGIILRFEIRWSIRCKKSQKATQRGFQTSRQSIYQSLSIYILWEQEWAWWLLEQQTSPIKHWES